MLYELSWYRWGFPCIGARCRRLIRLFHNAGGTKPKGNVRLSRSWWKDFFMIPSWLFLYVIGWAWFEKDRMNNRWRRSTTLNLFINDVMPGSAEFLFICFEGNTIKFIFFLLATFWSFLMKFFYVPRFFCHFYDFIKINHFCIFTFFHFLRHHEKPFFGPRFIFNFSRFSQKPSLFWTRFLVTFWTRFLVTFGPCFRPCFLTPFWHRFLRPKY